MIAIAPSDWHPVAQPPPEVLHRASFAMCGWKRINAVGWWAWTGIVDGVGWGLYVLRWLGQWRAWAFRTDALPAPAAATDDE